MKARILLVSLDRGLGELNGLLDALLRQQCSHLGLDGQQRFRVGLYGGIKFLDCRVRIFLGEIEPSQSQPRGDEGRVDLCGLRKHLACRLGIAPLTLDLPHQQV